MPNRFLLNAYPFFNNPTLYTFSISFKELFLFSEKNCFNFFSLVILFPNYGLSILCCIPYILFVCLMMAVTFRLSLSVDWARALAINDSFTWALETEAYILMSEGSL